MTGNHFLDRLPPADRDAVMAGLSPVTLTAGSLLIEQGRHVETVHFPTTAYLANVTLTPTGRRLQTAVIGREGLSGLAPFMAGMACAWEVNCPADGNAFAGSAARLRQLSDERPEFRRQLLALTHFYQAQSNQLAVCNAFHHVESRIARWILTVMERTGRDRLAVTQDDIAADLGIQRTSVVAGFQKLKRDHLVRHMRGRLEVANWAGLKARACSCYGRIESLAEEVDMVPVRESSPGMSVGRHSEAMVSA